jgi:protein HIRA/HIR1
MGILMIVIGTNEPPPVENWRVFRRLIGHDNDVQDLGWSEDSSILVSIGLDSKVVVWSGHTFEKLKTLSQHQSHVKGIAFDPANKYFATASDDRTIKVFRFTSPPPNATAHDQVNNFMLETTIVAPFANSPLTTYFRRCSWSPDGNHIAAANAVNGPVSSVAIVNRGTWDSDINLIGHEGPVEVCAFSPRMFYRERLEPVHLDSQGIPIMPSVTVIACAGQDKTLSVWNTSYARPFVITQELFSKPITDLAWTPDGETLFLTSLDGGIMAAVFESGELGYVADVGENERALTKFGAGRKAGIVEGTDAFILEELSKIDEQKAVQGRMGELMGDGASHPAPTTNGSSNPTPRTNGVSAIVNGTTPAQTNGQTSAPPATAPASAPAPVQESKVTQLKQRVEIVNGKKRIKPLLISSSGGASSLPQTQLIAGTQGARAAGDMPNSILDLTKPYDGLPRGGLSSLLVGNKRKYAEIEGDEERRAEKRLGTMPHSGSAPVVLNGVDGLIPPHMGARPDPEIPETLRPAIVSPALTVSQIRLAIPVLRSIIVRTMDASDPSKATEDTVMLEARNATGPSRTGRAQDRDPTRVSCTRHGQSLWQDYLPKPVLLLTGNQNFWAAACEDGSIYVWTPAGRRLLPAIILEANPVIMDCRGWYLLCISAVGMCHVWNLRTLKALHPRVSVGPVLDIASTAQGPHLTGAPGIVFARLNSTGRIIIALSNGDGYAYSPDMDVWQRLSEAWWAVASQYWNTTDSTVGNLQSSSAQSKSLDTADELGPENLSAGIIPLLERNTSQQSLLRGRSYYLTRLVKQLLVAEGFEGFEANVSVAHLENRVAAAMTLGARHEFKVYLLMYAKRLGAEGLKNKTEELLRSLLGNIFTGEGDGETVADLEGVKEAGRGWNSEEDDILGWKRLDLLRDVVLILGKSLITVCLDDDC